MDGKQVVCKRKQYLEQGDDQHDDGRIDHHLHVVAVDPLVDDALDQARDRQIHEYDADQKEQGNQASAPVGLYKIK